MWNFGRAADGSPLGRSVKNEFKLNSKQKIGKWIRDGSRNLCRLARSDLKWHINFYRFNDFAGNFVVQTEESNGAWLNSAALGFQKQWMF